MTQAGTTPWWEEPTESVHEKGYGIAQWLSDVTGHERLANTQFLRLYSNRALSGLGGSAFQSAVDSGERIRMNVVKSAIDAAVAHNGTNRPRPMFLTIGGNYDARKKAERLGRFVNGQFHAMQQYSLGLDVFRDAAVFGTGIEEVYEENGHLMANRIPPWELLLDPVDAEEGRPRQIIRHKKMPRAQIISIYPELEEHILNASLMDSEEDGTSTMTDRISVFQAWHLPYTVGADDGRSVLFLSNVTLEDGPCKRFPFAVFRWNSNPRGWFGQGAAEDLQPLQVEINYIAQKIQKLMTLATSVVWKERGSNVSKMSNKDWGQYEYTGRPPIFQTTASVSAEYFHHLDWLYSRAFELVGISQMQAQSLKPAGLSSGEALRVYNDIGTKRFQHIGQKWEQFHLDIAELTLDVAREVQESGDVKDFRVLTAGDKEVEEINFSEVDLDKDKYVMRIRPVSIMPDEPAGKVEMLRTLAAAAPDMGPHIIKLMTGIPDLESAVDHLNAPYDIADKMTSLILDKGEYEPPYPTMDLQLTRDLATRKQLQAIMDNAPSERIDMLRRFISQVDSLISKAKQELAAQEAPPAMPGGPPMPGGPGPTPTPAAMAV